ncbi:MAG: hypothetical protein GX299_07940 [Epulopiscium sp.]|nr:hypothetical protein [Candidatus Epulonipiscium sp.]
MVEWQNPKTDWAVNPKNPVPEDFNRIEGNIDFLKSDIETKKGVIVAAINDMNQPAEVTNTHAELADKIRDISNDATAVVGDVESGKTFYSAGAKKTGTLALSGTAGTGDVLSGKTFYNTALKTKRTGNMPNRGAVVLTPGTSNKAIVAGYHSGQGYVKGDANLVAGNIVSGKSIFGVAGSVNVGKKWGSGTVAATKPAEGGCLLSVRSLVFRPSFIWVEFAVDRIVRWAAPGLSPGFNTAWNTMYLYMWGYSGSDKADVKTDISITLYSNGFDIHFTGFTYPGAIAKWIAFE